MENSKRTILRVLFTMTFFLASTFSVVQAAEWSFSGKCIPDNFVNTNYELRTEIIITGNQSDTSFKATVYTSAQSGGLLEESGSYHSNTGRLKTPYFNGFWDNGQQAFVISSIADSAGRNACICKGATPPPGFDQYSVTSVFIGLWRSNIGITIIAKSDHTGSLLDTRPGQPGNWIGKWEADATRLYLTPDTTARYGGTVVFTLRTDGKMYDPWGNAYFK